MPANGRSRSSSRSAFASPDASFEIFAGLFSSLPAVPRWAPRSTTASLDAERDGLRHAQCRDPDYAWAWCEPQEALG